MARGCRRQCRRWVPLQRQQMRRCRRRKQTPAPVTATVARHSVAAFSCAGLGYHHKRSFLVVDKRRKKGQRHFAIYLNVYVALIPHETILDAEHPCYYCHNTLQCRVHESGHPERLDQPNDRRDHDSHHDRFADAGGGTTDRGGGVRLRLSPRLD